MADPYLCDRRYHGPALVNHACRASGRSFERGFRRSRRRLSQPVPSQFDPAKIVILKNSNDRRFDVLSRHVRRYGEYPAV